MPSIGFRFAIIIAAALLWGPAAAVGPLAEQLAAPPETTAIALSPNGRNLAIVRRTKGGANALFLVEIDTLKARQLINPSARGGVSSARWLDDEWITFTIANQYGAYGGYGRISIKATELVNDDGWYDDTCGYLDPIRAPPRGDGTAWMVCSGRDGGQIRIQDLKTGKIARAARDDRAMNDFVVDHLGQVRAAVECFEKIEGTACTSHYRDNDLQGFTPIASWITGTGGIVWPLGFDYDNRTLFVLANPGGGPAGVYRWNAADRTLGEKVFAHPEFDAGDIVVSRHERRVVGVRYNDGVARVMWIDPARAAVEKEVAALFPGESVRLEFSDDGKRAMVFVWSDRNPGEWHLFLPDQAELKFVGKRMPGIDPKRMARQLPINFPARDGLVIHGYLLLPPGKDPKGLPLIVNPHGGPFGIRDDWGFDPENQYLASLGYAVLQINFRGSAGYGEEFIKAGWGQWGLKMQDDITDGVLWAVAQGYADRDRICIYGASYGGYAALMGLIKTPELYRCGVTYAGVADLVTLYRDGTKRWSGLFRYLPSDVDQQRRIWFRRMIGGDLAKSGPLSARSPVHLVDRIKAPLMIAHGGQDRTASFWDHARLLRHEIEKNGAKVDWVFFEFEGHGFRKAENVLEYYQRLGAFFDKHLQKR